MRWNYFISHAHEDKALIAAPLAYALRLYNFDVWYDEFTLSLGDPLLQSIDNGLSNSEFGIIILSQDFLSKKWTQRELAGLMAKERDDKKVILPVWHNISINDLIEKSPILADRIGVSTEKGTQYIMEQIVKASYPCKSESVQKNLFSIPDNSIISLVREQLKQLIEKPNNSRNIRLLITAHQWLLKNFNAYEGNLIAAYKVGAEAICDFILVQEEGITGPMVIKMIKLGNPLIQPEDLLQYLNIQSSDIKQKLGKQIQLNERGRNDYIGEPYVGQFENTKTIADTICKVASEKLYEMRNIHWKRPYVWSFRMLLIAGRRDMKTVNDRENIATEHSIGLGIASFDRFFDNTDNRFFNKTENWGDY